MKSGLRFYQEKVLQQAHHTSTIAFLPTGSGKTLISAHLINVKIRELRNHDSCDKMFIAFVAPTLVLLEQQVAYLRENAVDDFSIKIFNGKCSYQGRQIDYWTISDWNDNLIGCDVMAMTPEIMRALLAHEILKSSSFYLLVLDECHHAAKYNHPMGKLCASIDRRCKFPLVFGMTASPINSKKNESLFNDMKLLENQLNAKYYVPDDEAIQCLTNFHFKPKLLVIPFHETELLHPLERTSLASPNSASSEPLSAAHLLYVSQNRLKHASVINFVHQQLNVMPELGMMDVFGRYPDTASIYQNITQRRGEIVGCGALGAVQEIVQQVTRVIRECGVYCALGALVQQLGEWREYGAHPETELDLGRVMTRLKEVQEGPFVKGSMVSPMLLDHQAACCLSLLELLLVLLSACDGNMCQEAWSALAVSDEFSANPSFSGFSIMRVAAGGQLCQLRYGLPGAVKVVAGLGQEILVERYLGERFIKSLQLVCRALLEKCSLSPLLGIFAQPPSPPSASDRHFPPLFSDRVLLFCKIWWSFHLRSRDYVPFDRISEIEVAHNAVRLMPFDLRATFADGSAPLGDQSHCCLVFCDLRLVVQSLTVLFSNLKKCCEQGCAAQFPITCDYLIGADTPSRQTSALKKAKGGELNVLFVTDVAEEGLDIQACYLVVNFNGPKTVKSFVQRRGRARAKCSFYISLAGRPLPKDELDGFPEFVYERGEQIVNDLTGFAAEDASMNQMLSLMSSYEYESERPSRLEHCFVSPATGARVDTTSAVSLIYEYCSVLGDGALPLFTHHVASKYTCSLLLPGGAPQAARVTTGPVCANKREAKGAVAVACVKKLFELGELNGHLLVPRIYQLNQNKLESMGVRKKLVRSKLRPRCMEDCAKEKQLVTKYYTYGVRVSALSEESRAMLFSNSFISQHLNALLHIGFAVECPLPIDVLSTPFAIHLNKGLSITMQFVQLGEKGLSRDEEAAMDAFQEAIYPAAPAASSAAAVSDFCDCPPSHFESAAHKRFLNVVPLPVISSIVVGSWACDSFSTEELLDRAVFDDADSFAAYLKACAGEAVLLFRNLHHNLTLKAAAEAEITAETMLQPAKEFPLMRHDAIHSLRDTVFAGVRTQGVFTAVPQEEYPQVGLLSVMREERVVVHNGVTTVHERKTFMMQFLKRFKLSLLEQLAADDKYFLVGMHQINPDVEQSMRSFLTPTDKGGEKAVVYGMQEDLRVIGRATWYFASRLVPSLLHRLHSLLIAQDLRREINELSKADDASQFAELPLSLVLTAITPMRALEDFNSERIEMLGDSVLKYVVTRELFRLFPNRNEGFLTKLRCVLVSNLFLAAAVEKHNLGQYLRPVALYSGNYRNCTPGIMHGAEAAEVVVAHEVKYKVLADMVEALLGAYFEAFGVEGAVFFMRALQFFPDEDLCAKVLKGLGGANTGSDPPEAMSATESPPKSEAELEAEVEVMKAMLTGQLDELKQDAPSIVAAPHFSDLMTEGLLMNGSGPGPLPSTVNPLPDRVVAESVCRTVSGLLGYEFRNLKLLAEALTHSSIREAANYQRLEFLGDAVLDLVVVCEKYRANPAWDQGQLTQVKHRITCNENLSRYGMKLQLFRHIHHHSIGLQELFGTLKSCKDIASAADAETSTCKVLADCVEALVGAIYLDCGSQVFNPHIQNIALEIGKIAHNN